MKVYITKYALTRGILKREVNACGSATMVRDAINLLTFYHADEWWESWEAARNKAEDMRYKKALSLKRQIEKLRKLEFKREGDDGNRSCRI